ncbi:transcriptional regulator CtsR [Clostridium acetobutylicum]|uniref:Transcriptional regulator CtsR n=1 Tax=Clostridium acetobutylicum (strain ATCC 824 / DSM 792 / JCM 1419 / IAM 19013 / LMG 5710 / NBRC 13948 / NRRL B-527 / VKM B-1787 / 2291 / W) TaxID=272562 RepID=Q97EC1_CLOAB|nr:MULTISPECIES: CtsR family transcriptional regulator [Clostridium]AAK81129.1 Transciptional regulator CTSR [Clostridium acetobutylicum ATCC 824]ADZ22233.1 Transciptional regulator CTSR [Clostridium acetobutylicum EA 2018]AEI33521.1 transciptional regulator CTSR [Clostridium acetobutylicum DSM 1731]AWV82105.1 CtsR family transcriptional regulator [Clostridium acetobutylicum]AWV82154.1 CtsR family transcriptional regulator [Clostridium acetobutylicum]
MRLSDIIEEFLKELIAENTENELEIQRNELANHFSCAPSQINYVLTTRFTTDKGYYIESRRGGGGCIRIRKVEYRENEKKPFINSIVDRIKNSITYDAGCKIIDGLFDMNLLTSREVAIIKACINDRALLYAGDKRNELRAQIMKSVLIILSV